ncbi:hypothetical protein ACH4FX_40010 [Streptomyces sp. NPDC018019]|uniref:hypothetical protein n=1 Tax=Streptomyces sp. NPDC018019 TaxID=3365030 RepID=UPI0037A57AB5
MAPVPVNPGIYRIDAHIIGPSAVLEATEYATKHGAPVITDRQQAFDPEQEWIVEPFESIPGSPYVIRLAHHESAGLVIHEDKLYVNEVPRSEWAKFTFEKVIGGIKILSDKGLAWRSSHRGAQIVLVPPKPEFQETWTLHYVSPINTM